MKRAEDQRRAQHRADAPERPHQRRQRHSAKQALLEDRRSHQRKADDEGARRRAPLIAEQAEDLLLLWRADELLQGHRPQHAQTEERRKAEQRDPQPAGRRPPQAQPRRPQPGERHRDGAGATHRRPDHRRQHGRVAPSVQPLTRPALPRRRARDQRAPGGAPEQRAHAMREVPEARPWPRRRPATARNKPSSADQDGDHQGSARRERLQRHAPGQRNAPATAGRLSTRRRNGPWRPSSPP